ncbi:MAG: Asp-tRNA(Asn)/Glu-tRNA(Gln) amidotransferase subunit GatC [Candidatus Doudnabacteria bacterium]|nr:Asp-tRNA(Asn)/Glu-tRNA(Gln) amidotransferase subunit GatC [Candidatus Doudnabacteria bacterium]
MLNIEEIKKLAKLARIEIAEEDLEKFASQLSSVLEYVEELKNVNTEGLLEVDQVTGLVNIQRADTVVVSDNREEIFSQAPEMKDGYYKVKAIL